MRRLALTVIAAAAVLAGCGTDTPDTPAAGSPPPSNTPTTTSDKPSAKPKPPEGTQVELTVKGGKRASGPSEVDVSAGEKVTFVVTGDEPDELHLHGYDKTADVQPGKPARLTFTADLPGVWELELHESGALLTELKVTG